MNTFLPYPDLRRSAECLDDKRLTNQVNECAVIHRALTATVSGGTGYRWHPATRMWRGYEGALLLFREACMDECFNRGIEYDFREIPLHEVGPMPHWLGYEDLHRSYQASLYVKDPGHYSAFSEAGEFEGYPYPVPSQEYYKAARRAGLCKSLRGRKRNGEHAVGLFQDLGLPVRVEYWTDLVDPDGPGILGHALDTWVLGDGTPVVKVDGYVGGLLMTRVRAIGG